MLNTAFLPASCSRTPCPTSKLTAASPELERMRAERAAVVLHGPAVVLPGALAVEGSAGTKTSIQSAETPAGRPAYGPAEPGSKPRCRVAAGSARLRSAGDFSNPVWTANSSPTTARARRSPKKTAANGRLRSRLRGGRQRRPPVAQAARAEISGSSSGGGMVAGKSRSGPCGPTPRNDANSPTVGSGTSATRPAWPASAEAAGSTAGSSPAARRAAALNGRRRTEKAPAAVPVSG